MEQEAPFVPACEWAWHGMHGKLGSPGWLFVHNQCPNCDGSQFDFFICHECYETPRLIACGECDAEVWPQEAWTPIAEW